jgi:hypothetical protein
VTLLLLISILFQTSAGQDFKISEIRNAYYAAIESSKSAEAFSDKLKSFGNSNSPILKGYKGMSEFLLSRHSINPYTKLNHFYKGRDLLEEAIKADPKNPELLFLRFTAQSNMPAFLNYSGNMDEDKKALMTYLGQKDNRDKELSEKIKKFLLQSKHLKEEEKEKLK